jgi:excisionase family DNA binding protein
MSARSVAADVDHAGGRQETTREQQVWPEILDVIDAAEFLRVSPATVRLALATKKLPGKRVGKEWRLSKTALIAWLSTPGEPKHYPSRRTAQPAITAPAGAPHKATRKRTAATKGK